MFGRLARRAQIAISFFMDAIGERLRAGRRAAGRAARMTVFALAVAGLPGVATAGGRLSLEDADRMAGRGQVVLIDVRSPGEWRRTGIPARGHAVTIHNPEGAKAFVREILKTVRGDRSRPVALICAAGVRSARALRMLESNGFSDVYDVSAGMSGSARRPGWIASGLPTRPCAGRKAC